MDPQSQIQVLVKQPVKWYVAYTRSNREKVVASCMNDMGVATFLPLRRYVRQWSDRKKVIVEPIFKSYLFVNVNMKGYYRVLTAPGVVRFITSQGKPLEVKQEEIDLIKKITFVAGDIHVEPVRFVVGDRVMITQGFLVGHSGILIEYRGKQRVAVFVDSMEVSIIVNVPLDFLVKM